MSTPKTFDALVVETERLVGTCECRFEPEFQWDESVDDYREIGYCYTVTSNGRVLGKGATDVEAWEEAYSVALKFEEDAR